MGARRGRAGSILLLVAASVVLLRPWEPGALPWTADGGPGPRSAVVRVLRAVDGDTIEVRLGDRREDVRLIGVDTPETVDPEAAVQCFGPRASRFQHRLVEGRRLRLVFGVERRDTYGRLLAYAYIGHRFLNAELLRRGLARTLTIPPNDRFSARFERLELAAAGAGRGLWGGCRP
jgi:micrococcal nuclease